MTRDNVLKKSWNPWTVRFRLIACLMLVAVGTVSAQDDKAKGADNQAPATAQTHPENPMMWDTEAMMNQAVDQISRRYNLNDQQKEYTRLLLVSRVREFLDQHEMEVRQLLQESIEMRTGQRPSDAVALQVWANRALPLYQEASKAILEGNEEWSVILDDEQRKIHDRDMTLMRRSFKNATQTMNTWQDGKGKLPTVAGGEKVNNKKNLNTDNEVQQAGSVSKDPVVKGVVQLEDNWLAYVNAFINTYSLEGKDEVSARDKILKDTYAQARKYRELNKRQFDKLSQRQKNAAKDKTIRIHDVLKQKKLLEMPIREMFVKLDKRLRRLPTAEQFANADADQKKRLEEYYKALAGDAAPDKAADGSKANAKDVSQTQVKSADEKNDDAKTKKVEASTPAKDKAESKPQKKDKEPAEKSEKPDVADGKSGDDRAAA